MSHYDVLFIHPPAVYDFRQKIIFPGIFGSSLESVQYTKVPIGLLSLAEYLDRYGYKVRIDNIGDRMVSSPDLDVEEHLKNTSARIYAIGLHFQWHAQGALEIARLCKQLHPHSMVVMGGLTATCFHEEILQKYEFVDAVIRGEAEMPFLEFLKGLEKGLDKASLPNLTFRTETGEVISTPLSVPVVDLDQFEYTRFDLLEPRTSVINEVEVPRWSLEVCRGCVYNCAICGGSAYTYRKYLGRRKPAFRSPSKIVRDIKLLNEQGIHSIGLYQDPRMGGKAYWQELLSTLHREDPQIDSLSLDLLVPADEDFIRDIAAIGKSITVHICPDTGCNSVRRKLGRHYSTERLLETIRLCHKYFIQVTSFFSVGLAEENNENLNETWELWDKLSSLEQIALTRGNEWELGSKILLGGPILGPIMLDPGSLAFDNPAQYGYKLLFRNLAEYVHGLSQPSWHQWLNYETESLNKTAILEMIVRSIDFTIDQRAEYGLFTPAQAESQRRRLKADIAAMNGVNRLMVLEDPADREAKLKDLRRQYDAYLGHSRPGQPG